jgi:hemolysin activation/secretion protein
MVFLRCLLLMLVFVQAALAASAQPANEPARFDILAFVVEGDTLLGPAAIERVVYPFLGEARSAADAEGARRALEKAYQDAGFLSVGVTLPPQQVQGGEVRLVVVAAAVARLRFEGAEHQRPLLLRQALPSVAPGNVPNFNEMQQELAALAQARPDTQLTPVLAAGARAGTLDVTMRQEDRLPLSGQIELNNKRSPNTEEGRAEIAVGWDNLFQARHALSLFWLVAPSDARQSNVLSTTYHAPLGGVGDRLFLTLTSSDSDTPTALGGSTISRGQTWRLRWRDELAAPQALSISHAITWGATWRDLKDRNLGIGGVDVESPPLRYGTLQLGYEFIRSGEPGAPAGRSTRLNAEWTLGAPALAERSVDCFGQERDPFACKRANASARFQALTLGLTHNEPIGRWLLSTRLSGQIADTPLVPSEQLVIGGPDSVRGYLEGEQAGDLGALVRLELAAPPWALADGWQLKAQAFYDHGWLRRFFALASEPLYGQLASTGIGLRLNTRGGVQASLDFARLLRDSERDSGGGLRVPVSGGSAGVRERWVLAVRQVF